MNRLFELTLKVLRRKVYPKLFHSHELPELEYINDKEACNREIAAAILKGDPFMVARFGSTELGGIVNYVGIRDNEHSVIKYIRGDINEWWWNWTSVNQLQSHSGFFPITEENVIRFSKLMIDDMQQVDILGSWCKTEYYVRNYISNAKKYWLGNIEPPYLTCDDFSWTYALKGKRVLLVHPFADTAASQYNSVRTKLFNNPDFIPEFTLLTVKAVQSLGGNDQYSSWFEALDYMKSKMDELEYDVAIIGCGAYGMPLAAHAKRTGHVALHLGGATQLLWGITGRRWEEQERCKPLFNEYWVRPDAKDRPKNYKQVEGACYW